MKSINWWTQSNQNTNITWATFESECDREDETLKQWKTNHSRYYHKSTIEINNYIQYIIIISLIKSPTNIIIDILKCRTSFNNLFVKHKKEGAKQRLADEKFDSFTSFIDDNGANDDDKEEKIIGFHQMIFRHNFLSK